jgi:hypothetical protein
MAELGTRDANRKSVGRTLSAYSCARHVSTRRLGTGNLNDPHAPRNLTNGFVPRPRPRPCECLLLAGAVRAMMGHRELAELA